MAYRFACASCGCPSVKLPTELTAHAVVACDQCDAPLATWDEFKRLTTSIVLADRADLRPSLDAASYDPLADGSPGPDFDPTTSELITRPSAKVA